MTEPTSVIGLIAYIVGTVASVAIAVIPLYIKLRSADQKIDRVDEATTITDQPTTDVLPLASFDQQRPASGLQLIADRVESLNHKIDGVAQTFREHLTNHPRGSQCTGCTPTVDPTRPTIPPTAPSWRARQVYTAQQNERDHQ